MMAVPVRVALFQEATLTIKEPGRPYNFPCTIFPELGGRGSAEQQLDTRIRLVVQDRPNLSLRVTVETDVGEPFEVDFEMRRSRFESTRACMAQAYQTLANEASTLEDARGLQRQAQLLDGRARCDLDLPARLRVKPNRDVALGRFVPRLPRAGARSHGAGFCHGCGLRVPRLHGYQDGQLVVVLQLHRGKANASQVPRLCYAVAHDWAWLDARPLHPLQDLPAEAPPVEDRVAWMERHLAMVPVELGGPLLDQLPALQASHQRAIQRRPA